MKIEEVIENSSYSLKSEVSVSELEELESKLGIQLPDELRKLLLRSNGIVDEFKCFFIWPLERILSDNTMFRRNEVFKDIYMPFDSLLFFSDAGNGDQFAYRINGNKILSDDIYVWNHEDDSRTWVSSNLMQFISGWITGSISI